MTEEPLALVVEFRAAPGRLDDLRAALLDLTRATRAEDGCLRYDLHAAVQDPDVLVFYEVWATPAAPAAHDATPHVTSFVARLPELTAEPPRMTRLRRLEPSEA